MADRRDFAGASMQRYIESIDEQNMRVTIALFVDLDDLDDIDEDAYWLDEDKLFFELPAEYEVCSGCDGKGSYVNPNIDRNGITAREMERMGPQFRENYMGGVYDVTCKRCDGKRVECVPNTDCLSDDQRELVKLVSKQVESDRYMARVQRAEMGLY